MLLRLVFVFYLAMAFNAPAWAEAVSANAKVDPLVELGKRSEDELLLIEHSLAALYYYPNILTGKPTAELVDAIKRFQHDRNSIIQAADGVLSDEQIEMARNESLQMGGSPNFPSDPRKIAGRIDEDTIFAKGLLVPRGEQPQGQIQDYVYIVCRAKLKLCHSTSVNFIFRTNYALTLQEYEIQSIHDEVFIARKILSFNSAINPEVSRKIHQKECHEQLLTINVPKQSITLSIKKNPASRDGCGTQGDKISYYDLVGVNASMRKDHYALLQEKAQRKNFGKSDDIARLSKASEGWIEKFYGTTSGQKK